MSLLAGIIHNARSARLLHNWKHILLRAWSIRWAVLSGLLSGVAAVLPYFDNAMPLHIFVAVTIFVSLGASISALMVVWARVTYQANLHDT